MAQSDFGTIDPSTKSGSSLATDLNDWRDAMHSGHSGASRPAYAVADMIWVKIVSASLHEVYLFDGTDDILLFSVDLTNNIPRPLIDAGSVATPAIAPSADLNTGLYFPAADEMAFAVGGQKILHVKQGFIGIGNFALGSTYFVELRRDQNAATIQRLFNNNVHADSEARLSLGTGTANSALNIGLKDNNGSPYAEVTCGSAVSALLLTLATQIGQTVALTGVITPAQITANQNDYNPTGLSTAAVIRQSSDAARDITGLAGGSNGRIVWWFNIGPGNQVFKDDSASSTAANRFALDGDLTLGADQSVLLRYDGTSQRWRVLSGGSGSGVADIQTFTASGTWTKPAGCTWVMVEGWGAGGGGGRNSLDQAGSGGGGGYVMRLFRASDLAATVAVTIGAGGTAATSGNTNGGEGGSTTFGAHLTAPGGSGGTTANTGGRGGLGISNGGWGDEYGGIKDSYGGGGGGGGGTSVIGGNGGAKGNPGVAGSAPGGGGGGGSGANSPGGAGARGECRVYSW